MCFAYKPSKLQSLIPFTSKIVWYNKYEIGCTVDILAQLNFTSNKMTVYIFSSEHVSCLDDHYHRQKYANVQLICLLITLIFLKFFKECCIQRIYQDGLWNNREKTNPTSFVCIPENKGKISFRTRR